MKNRSNSLFQKKEVNIFLILTVSIFISETLIMLLLRFLPAFSDWGEALLDASLLSLIIFPIIYFFLVKPLKESITDRNKKEARYLTLIDNMGEGVIICNADEKFIFANKAAEKLFGYKKEELIGTSLELFFSAANYSFIVAQTNKRKNGEPGFYESEILLKNGMSRKVFITATPQFENGIFTGTLAIFRDISALKKAEESLKYERNLLRTLIDNLPDAVYVKDDQFRKIIANPVDLRYMGFESESQVLGKKDDAVYPKEIAESSYADDLQVFKSGQPYINKEDYFIDNRNQEHWMLNSKVPIKDADGKITGLVGIGREITERKKEEIRLKLLESVITNATDAVIITQMDANELYKHKIIFVNKAYCKMTGYLPEEVIGKTPSILQGPKTDRKETDRVRESLSRYEPCHMEVINYKKNGEEFWSSIAFSPIADNQGKYTHWIAIKRDVTEHKKLEQNYIAAKEKAEAGSKAKSEFLANMSHEIRTPLNSVIGFSELLMKTHLDHVQQQYNSAVFQSANSLLEIINEILDFSKIEADKLEIDIDKLDVIDLCYHVVDMISYQANKKNLELLLNISSDIPRFIWSDSVRLRQILINLLGNAVKFTTTGEVELKVEMIREISEKLSVIRFSVRDTGVGILPENQQKIFEAFAQEDSSTNRKYGGTGLGLAISKKLLGLMGSGLSLNSIPGKGSTFYFDLEVEILYGAPSPTAAEPAYKNILIVDDNSNNRLLLSDMLALKGIKSDEAENGPYAINILRMGKKYDLILMDYNMPVMDGIETTAYIRDHLKMGPEELPIILLHSSAEDEILSAGCQKYEISKRLVKPVKLNQLFDALTKEDSFQETVSGKLPAGKETTVITDAGITVLLVDDNELNIMLIRKIISEILPNAILVEAFNGREAVNAFTIHHPALIFMDVQMPEMNGHEATRVIRQLEEKSGSDPIPVIALTAGTQAEERELCLNAGMTDFITKPFLSNAIVEIVNKWL